MPKSFGQRMLEQILPQDVYRPGMEIDKKSINSILSDVAKRYPDQYPEIADKLMRFGRDAAESTGGASFTLKHLRTPPKTELRRREIADKIREIITTASPDQQHDEITSYLRSIHDKDRQAILDEASADGNPFALMLKGAGRGNPASLARLIGSDILYADASGNPVPVPILNSYAKGLTPGEFAASTFGARSGLVTAKMGVGAGGYLCFPGNTEIRMADGSVKSIEQIKRNDWVLGADMSGQTFPVRVKNRWDNGEQEVSRFDLRQGSSKSIQHLVATPGHEVLIQCNATACHTYGKRMTPELGETFKLPIGQVKRKIRIVSNGPAMVWSGKVVEPLAWVIGYLIGNGCLSNNKVRFACDDDTVIAAMRKTLSPAGFDVRHARKRRPDRVDFEWAIVDEKPLNVGEKEVGGVLTRTEHRLKLRLEQLGLMGLKAQQKFIPAEVWAWDKESIANLLSGLIESDGCVSRTNFDTPTVSLGMTSHQVVETARDLFRVVFGIHPSNIKTYRVKDSVTKSPNMPNIPHSNYPLQRWVLASHEGISRFVEQIPAIATKTQLAVSLLRNREFKQKQGAYFKVVGSQPVGRAQVYDLEVDSEDHLYVLASGMVVSNSKGVQGAAHRMVVTDLDGEDTDVVALDRGLPVDTEDPDNVGALLARDIGPYPRNTPLTPKIMADIRKRGHDEILVRSPITTSDPDGGVYARDVGYREKDTLPEIGESVGVTAAASISEPITQATLSANHTAGMDTGTKAKLSGFALIEKLFNPPKDFRDAATHADLDGTVESISKAPQGGHYVTVEGKQHFVPAGVEVTVTKGQQVEAGDQLTEGYLNPHKVIKYKGIGEGARQMTDAMRRAISESGTFAHRRNLELVMRGLVDRVRMTSEYEDYLPDDVVPYGEIAANYKPREGHRVSGLEAVRDRYLEVPVLHYTIGTRLTPSVINRLKKHNVQKITTHAEPPPFESEMVRTVDLLKTDSDWMTRQLGTGVTKTLQESAHRGRESDESGTSFVPGRARAVDFGRQGFLKIKSNSPPRLPQLGHQ